MGLRSVFPASITTLGLPVLQIVAAIILARITGLANWARLVGPGTKARTVLKYIGLIALVNLAVQGGTPYLRSWIFPAFRDFRFAYFIKPQLNLHLVQGLLAAPISEELIMRGWLMGWLDKKGLSAIHVGNLKLDQAMILTSLVFAFAHFFRVPLWYVPFKIVSVFIQAMVFAYAKRESNGLLIPMLCHATTNFIGAYILIG